MNRKTALALVGVMVAISAGVVVGSSTVATFTTDSDFNDATTTENFTIEGSGDSASLDLQTQDSSQATRAADNNVYDTADRRGVEIATKSNTVTEVTATLSSNTEGITTVYLLSSGNNVIASASPSGGDVTFSGLSLSPDSTYFVVADADGATYTSGYDVQPESPYQSQYVDITGGYQDGGSYSSMYNIESIDVTANTHDGGRYVSQRFPAERLDSGTVDIALSGMDATVTWQQDDDGDGSWTDITSATYSSGGTKTDTFGAEYDTVRAVVEMDRTAIGGSGAIHSASVGFEAEAPDLDSSGADPQGGDRFSEDPVTLSIPVSDPDFATEQGDEVTVDFYLNGTLAESTTVTSNGTASVEVSADTLGDVEWYAQATDSFGQTTTSDTFYIETPSALTFRNETQPSEIITGASATITLYSVDGTTVITRSDDDGDGKISLNGLENTEFVISVEADNFYNRRIYLENIFEQSDVFLINETAYPDAVFTEFQLDDRTGNFVPGETTLRVQRALDVNGSGESEWRTIAGDFFGSTNRFPFTGQYQTRYRLVVENQRGDRRVLGTYTPTVGGTQSVPIGAVSFSGELANGTAFRAIVQEEGGYRYLHVKYLDTDGATESLTYNVVRADNESIEILANVTETDIDEEYLGVYNLSARDPAGATGDVGYRVNYWAERSGNNTSGYVLAGAVRNLDFGLDDRVRTLLAWTFLVAIAGVTALYNWKLSMLTVPTVASGFAMTGILAIPSVLIALAFVTAGLFWMGEGRYR